MGTGMNYVNLLKPLEYALHKGCDGVTGNFAGLESPESYESFECFFAEYKKQLGFLIEQVIEVVNGFEDYLAYINPQSMLSATYPTCIEQGKDALHGGAAANGSGMMFGFMADVADSLTNIKKYVFDNEMLTLDQLRDILDKNFEDNEQIRRILLADRDKYGNNKELPDAFAKEIAEFVCAKVCGRPNAKKRGGKWNLGFHVARQSYDQASMTAASPNGRKKGEELSKNLSASMGRSKEGATAAILSITKIDATKFSSDACLDLGLLPSAVKGEDGLEAMYALLATFIKRGGHALHINVFDAETLRYAQREPEKYSDLQIRVCGWNVLWNNISKEEQDGFIRQAEGLV
jgi:formate C-acetyltransferase